MFHELTGYPHDSNAVQSALRLQLRQARLAKKKPTWSEVAFGKQMTSHICIIPRTSSLRTPLCLQGNYPS